MGRYKPNRVVRANWWDADESATLKGSLGFLPAQRVQLFMGKVQAMTRQTEDETAIMVDFMGKVLLELLDAWTLRKRETPYQEGLDRPKLDLSLEELSQLPFEDIAYLYSQSNDSLTPADTAVTMTTAAAEAGLTAANFRPGDSDPVAVSG